MEPGTESILIGQSSETDLPRESSWSSKVLPKPGTQSCRTKVEEKTKKVMKWANQSMKWANQSMKWANQSMKLANKSMKWANQSMK